MTAPYVHESSYADEGVAIGDDTKVWHFCHIQSGASIGRGCSLGQNVYVGANAKIGDGVKIQNNVSVYEGVELGDHVFCGPSCVFTNDLTPRAKYPKGGDGDKRTAVRRGASAMVGSGAVVTSDVPPHALVLGVPARQRGWACECGAVLSEDLACSACGRTYAQSDEGLKEVQHGVS